MAAFDYLKAVGQSDIGRRRKNNEDSFGMFPELGVWLVADGMGGGDDGEVASAAVVGEMSKLATACGSPAKGAYAADDVVRAVVASADRASAWIFARTREKRLSSSGSTVVGCVADATRPGRMVAFHAGDSRLYRLRGRKIRQITKDHSVAEMMGAKDEEKINPMFRGMVFRAVGIKATVEVELTEFDVKSGDRILICSDGLSKMVADREISSVSRGEKDVGKAVEALISAANAAGGVDNVTVILIEVGELPEAAERAPFPINVGEPETVSSECATGATGIVAELNGLAPGVLEGAAEAPDAGETTPLEGETPPLDKEPAVRAEKRRRELRISLWLRRLSEWRPSRRMTWTVAAVLIASSVVGLALAVAHRENKVVARTDDVRIADVNPLQPERPSVAEPAKVAPSQLIAALTASNETDVAQKADVPPATNAAPAALRAKPQVPVSCEVLAKRCVPEEIATLKELVSRRLSEEKVSQFCEQMNRALTSAKAAHRIKTPEASDRFVVDLKYALQAAGEVRKALSGNRAVVVDWDLVAEGGCTPESSRMAAARLLKNLPEALR